MKKILTMAALTLLTLCGCNNNKSSVEKKEKIETPPYAASTKTWTFGKQVWSDAIRIPECNKASFSESLDTPDCRSYTDGSETWYYYNWAYVDTKKITLCPDPWRVPTEADFDELIANTTNKQLVNAWGLPGTAYGSYMQYAGSDCYIWSADKLHTYGAYSVFFDNNNASTRSADKNYGFQVRCVR
jgi:uncharacterized lipoprotein NlpE involved in copper resistance